MKGTNYIVVGQYGFALRVHAAHRMQSAPSPGSFYSQSVLQGAVGQTLTIGACLEATKVIKHLLSALNVIYILNSH